ncbi:MAG: histidine phosphatase family protein [Alphaproteobacteria bacterium]
MSEEFSIYLIRHGEATGGWDQDMDPGLSALGQQQARDVAQKLAPLGPLPVITSPMRRTQETAAAFTGLWGNEAIIDQRVSEVPSPTDDLDVRREWLMQMMPGKWSDPVAQRAGPHDLAVWRRELVDAVTSLTEPTVITSHFVAINVLVGHIMGDDSVVCFRPDNCSVTEIISTGGDLRVSSLGHEAETEVG